MICGRKLWMISCVVEVYAKERVDVNVSKKSIKKEVLMNSLEYSLCHSRHNTMNYTFKMNDRPFKPL